MSQYPFRRMQRFRHLGSVRSLVQENRVHVQDLIYPLFVKEGASAPTPVHSMPGVVQHTLSTVVKEAQDAFQVGIKAIILFGIPALKDETGDEALSDHGIVQQAIRAIKVHCPDLLVIADCCLCEYTSHGHCGILENQQLDMSKTLEVLSRLAVSYAAAGADCIAPSGMMDGMVQAIRQGLDAAGFFNTLIMSYSVKYASSFYGPFREAAGSDFTGDRRHHQLAPSQSREGIEELRLDIQEGADLVMIKPGLPYLDMVLRVRQTTDLPVVVYQVSGEYAMLSAAAQNGMINLEVSIDETLLAFKRAGADLIITYFALAWAKRQERRET